MGTDLGKRAREVRLVQAERFSSSARAVARRSMVGSREIIG